MGGGVLSAAFQTVTRWRRPRVSHSMAAVAPPMTEAVPEAPAREGAGAWDDASSWVELFRALAAGDADALGPLYDMASRRLFGLALWRTGSRELAADVVQEVFVRVAEHRDRLGAGTRTALVAAVGHPPAGGRCGTAGEKAAGGAARRPRGARGGADGRRPGRGRASAPGRLVRRLSAKQREVVYLHDAAGMSHAEIGRCLGIPAFTAASRYRLAVAALRNLLGSTT